MNDSTDETVGDQKHRSLALAKAIRETRGKMLQVDFARLIDRRQSVISNWETNVKTPNLDTLADVEDRLGLPLGYFAVRAGYFMPEALTGQRPDLVACQSHQSLGDAVAAIEAADLLGLKSRLDSEAIEGARVWHVEVLRASGIDPGPLGVSG